LSAREKIPEGQLRPAGPRLSLTPFDGEGAVVRQEG